MLWDHLRRNLDMVIRDPFYAPRVLGALVLHPSEARERIAERFSEWSSGRGPRPHHQVTPDWEAAVHRGLGAPWPCAARDEFGRLWTEAVESLRTRGLAVGRATYGGWDDADPALARLVWCATLHCKPEHVVETGVARGLTSRFILEALASNGHGRLWSIDVPPLIDPGLRHGSETGAAVPERLRGAWTYIWGSSRKRLPSLVRQLGRVDLFVHDSMHTTRNVAFELSHVWPAVAPGGVVIVDDIERNTAFASFAAAQAATALTVTGLADDGVANIGIAIRVGAPALVRGNH